MNWIEIELKSEAETNKSVQISMTSSNVPDASPVVLST